MVSLLEFLFEFPRLSVDSFDDYASLRLYVSTSVNFDVHRSMSHTLRRASAWEKLVPQESSCIAKKLPCIAGKPTLANQANGQPTCGVSECIRAYSLSADLLMNCSATL